MQFSDVTIHRILRAMTNYFPDDSR